ncbi:MAG: sarcosine oxidase subunit delta [Nitrospinota bacterium]|jgi:sarcosine oxidase subunit delta|nr:sarcosine oxidase subunit delta [Nitrospinota bacterium]
MSFLIPCPQCGSRSAYEFRFGGEYKRRPAPDASDWEWTRYNYLQANVAGVQKEWWYHRDGCGAWFLAERNTVTNEVVQTFWPEESPTE